VAADHYAARLVEAVDELHLSHSKSPKKAAAKPRKPQTVKKPSLLVPEE
jgi:hypothetical protein